MNPIIEFILIDTDGNYRFSTDIQEFILPPNNDSVDTINKLIDAGVVKTESITKLQELNII